MSAAPHCIAPSSRTISEKGELGRMREDKVVVLYGVQEGAEVSLENF